ncbi:hypothetical protein J4210_03825 [Candidatus Woesearchaeota archaeon]|nr:hypothetical protein [Candidatus Woesearchaeota archaeon]
MVSKQELWARVKEFLRFSRSEIANLLLAVILIGFIFSFRDWGTETFDVVLGLRHFLGIVLVTGISISFRISCQKIFALSQGYNAEFRIWWAGLLIMLVLAFISFGRLPVILIGTVVASLMVKQRLGEFRYGFSYRDNALIGLWGIYGNLIIALIFAIMLYFNPANYYLDKGVFMNLVMAFFALLPLPQLDGLQIFFGSRSLYYLGILLVLLAGVLLLSRTSIGLILAIIISALLSIFYILISSGK